MNAINYSPRPLSPSREYPGYQFHAVLSLENRSADECFRYAALTIQNWLCERIKEADGIVPEEIICPKPDEYMTIAATGLHSCRLPYAEIISLPEQGVWSFMVREPDPEIAARAYGTYAGLRIKDENEVEFAVCITVTDRDPMLPEKDKAYRPQFIRLLFETDGMTLRQACPLLFRKYTEIRDRRGINRLKELADDRTNQHPLIVFTQAERRIAPVDFESIASDVLKKPGLPPSVTKSFHPAPPADPKRNEHETPYDVTEFARHVYGFALVWLILPEAFPEFKNRFRKPLLNDGDIVMIEPKAFGGTITTIPYQAGMRSGWYKDITDDLLSSLQCYSKHKPYDYGNVLFIEEARQLARALELDRIRGSMPRDNSEELRSVLEQLERERELSHDQADQIHDLRVQMLSEYQRGVDNNQQRINELEEQLLGIKAENARLKATNESMRSTYAEFSAMKSIVEQIQCVPELPRNNRDIVEYFSAIYGDRLGFTERGRKTAGECDILPEVLWECLYKVASVLVDLYRNAANDIEGRFRESAGWELAESEGAMTKKNTEYMNLRKDIYDGREISVEPHIKFPNSLRKTGAQYQRLYYAYDPITRRIIIGYIGFHLENFSSLNFH